jgi:hypothetical protein
LLGQQAELTRLLDDREGRQRQFYQHTILHQESMIAELHEEIRALKSEVAFIKKEVRIAEVIAANRTSYGYYSSTFAEARSAAEGVVNSPT